MNKNLALTDAQYAYLSRMRSRAGDTLLAELRRETEALGEVGVMIATEEQGDFFTLLTAALGVKSAREPSPASAAFASPGVWPPTAGSSAATSAPNGPPSHAAIGSAPESPI